MYWNLYAEYADGTIINEDRDYDNEESMANQQYDLEFELVVQKSLVFGECIDYSVALMYD